MESEGLAIEEIAIIGMATRFPGALSVDEFWGNLRDGVESIRSFTPEELAACGVDEAARSDPNFVNSGVLADQLDAFDAAFFGVSPREAQIMDPQHRILLETAWEALERAGYDPERYPGHIGVYGSVAPNTYREKILSSRPELLAGVGDYLALISSEREYAVTRIAFKLNLRGASLSVNTACSSSGVGIHLACQSLLAGENDMCLVGGARVRAPLTAGYFYQEDGILSPDGHCRAFDAEARGTAIGNGAGMIVLKRLEDAIEDRDWIHAVIKGTAINNDGAAKVGFTAPGVEGQSAVIAEAHSVAGISADTIGYIEAHGTGTILGDPIEVEAATQAFRQTTNRTGFCSIGSVKTNIGHLDAGAGVAGVIKTALALEHAQLPPSLNFSQPNPQIDFANSPFFVNDRLRAWETQGEPRRAGVSSFGLGGTNAHVVLEEAPPRREAVAVRNRGRRYQLLPWSARTPTAFENATNNLNAYLSQEGPGLADVAYTLQTGRQRFAQRGVVIATTRGDAVQVLETADRSRMLRQADPRNRARPIAFLFPGGGAQYIDMGRDLYSHEAVFREAVDQCLAVFDAEICSAGDAADGLSLKELLYPAASSQARTLESERPTRALPLLFSVEYALAQLWMHWGLQPTAVLGHSMGEYTAACIAGVISLDQACRIVLKRGQLFEKLAPGSMLSVPLPSDDERIQLDSTLSIAAINRPGACVVAGPDKSVDALQAELERQDIECARVHISVAAHSQMVEPILEEFRSFLGGIDFQAPQIPYVSNVSGTWITPQEATDPDYWVKHLRQTVRFADGLETLLADGDRIAIEVGPGQTLSTFARQRLAKSDGQFVIPSMRHPREVMADDAFVLGSLGRAWLAGAVVDWESFNRDETRQHVPLPTYPFERVRYWVDAAPSVARNMASTVQTTDAPAQAEPPTDIEEKPVADSMSRKDRIAMLLAIELQELTGFNAADLDPHATFLELGCDSLLLTQANNAFRKRFGVSVTFRQLFDDTPTLDQLADYIDKALPTDQVVEPALNSAVTPSNTRADSFAPASNDTVIAGVAPDADDTSAQQPAARHGPWNPPSVSSDGDRPQLTARQQHKLGELIARFTARTHSSKQQTQKYRAQLSDPRTAAGFRSLWKEMVYPIVADRARGSKLYDVDGNEWLDITMGFGVTLFGHSPDFITQAIGEQLEKGMAIGPQTSLAGEVAELICELTGLDRAAFCNTGSEAVLAATRAARTVSGRDRIVVFRNSYHGMFDEVVVKGITVAGEPRSLPVSPGIPQSAVEHVVVLEYGDPGALEVIRSRAEEFAAVLVEPVQSRNPELRPTDFVRELRQLTQTLGIALIFDEMVTGFRMHPGGAQAYYGVKADIATYGKVVGGGMPIGIVAGKAEYLDALDGGDWEFGDDSAPEAGVTWFAGTFVRHPLALAAARAALTAMKDAGPDLQAQLNRRATQFRARANELFLAQGFPIQLVGFSSLFQFQFSYQDDDPTSEYASLYFHYLRDRNIHCHEGRPHFLTTAHTDEDIAQLLDALISAADEMRQAGFLPSTLPTLEDATIDHTVVPLTDGQLEIWLAAQFDDDASRAFHLSGSIELKGKLDLNCLQRAVAQLVQRHAALRTTVRPVGVDTDNNFARESQRIADASEVRLLELDFSTLSAADQLRKIEEFHNADAEELFDLEQGPLVRFALIRQAADRHRLVITAHHIICDGWSLGILMRDLGALYAGAQTGLPAALSTPLSFGNYALEQSSGLASEDGRRAEAYWLSCFSGELPILELPTDHPRPPVKTYASGQLSIALDLEMVNALKVDSAQRGATLFATLLSAYSVFLKRLAGHDDVVIGVATAGQPAAGARDLVGHCVQFYPFRLQSRRDEGFSTHLCEIQNVLVDSLDHANYSFGRLLTKLSVTRDPSRLPLISTLVTYESETAGLSFGDLDFTISNNAKRFCNFDIELYLTESADGLRVEFHYNRDIFDAATITRWLQNYKVLIESILAVGDAAQQTPPLQDIAANALPMLSSVEHALLSQWNATSAPLPGANRLHEHFESMAAANYENIAVLVPANDQSPTFGMTYGEINARANQLARHLSHIGISSGDTVALCLPRTPDILIGLLATLKAGACYLPFDLNLPVQRLEYMLADSGARALITDSRAKLMFATGGLEICSLEESADTIARQAEHNLGLDIDAESLAYLIYTSGSTGRPKGVDITHRAVVNLLESISGRPGFSADDTLLAVSTFSFDISILELLLPAVVGGRVVLANESDVYDPKRLAYLIKAHEITVMQATPATWRLLLESGWSGAGNLKVISGGEALAPDLASALGSRVKSLWNGYGPTETTIYSTGGEVLPGCSRITIGRPIANTTIHILDEWAQRVPIGTPGELVIGGAGVARGYRGRPELTVERFISDPFSTAGNGILYRSGDTARWLSNGEIEYLGRADNQVKLRGFRIELGEIESALREVPEIRQAAVVLREDTPGDPRLVAYFESHTQEVPSRDVLREILRKGLPEYMIPSAYVHIAQLPLTANRKLDRKALPVPQDVALPNTSHTFNLPGTDTEKKMAELWEEILQYKPIGVDDNFFELGGYSLLAARLIARIDVTFGVDIPLRSLFQDGTVKDLAALVDARLWSDASIAGHLRLNGDNAGEQVEIEL
jgi:amino acid adenylation domain-containing protein